MGASKVRTLSSALFALGKQTMKVSLVHAGTRPKPYGVHVIVRNGSEKGGGKTVESGWTGLDEKEDRARELFNWTCDEAKKKGWGVGPKRGGGRLRILSGVPAPRAIVGRPPAPASVSSRLMKRHDQAIAKAKRA